MQVTFNLPKICLEVLIFRPKSPPPPPYLRPPDIPPIPPTQHSSELHNSKSPLNKWKKNTPSTNNIIVHLFIWIMPWLDQVKNLTKMHETLLLQKKKNFENECRTEPVKYVEMYRLVRK